MRAWRLPSDGYADDVLSAPGCRRPRGGRPRRPETALADPALTGTHAYGVLTHDSPARALIERAERAGLVVVGTRGRGRVTSALLGSVSRQLLQHAPVPVVAS